MNAQMKDVLLNIESLAGKLESGKKEITHPKLPGFPMPQYDQNDSENLQEKISVLCDIYLEMSESERKRARDFLANIKGGVRLPSLFYLIPYCLYDFIRVCAAKIKTNTDLHCLHLGLAAAAIEAGKMDFRDLFKSLGELFMAGERAGIDPVPHFMRIAELSDENGQKLIAHFHESAYLKSIRKITE